MIVIEWAGADDVEEVCALDEIATGSAGRAGRLAHAIRAGRCPIVRAADAPVGEHPSAASDWMSPFDDELGVPTFIRRGGHRDEDEEIEDPAFLRRSAD